MMTNSIPDDIEIPYYYCSNCEQLCPVAGDVFNHLTCLSCEMTMDLTTIGRRVLLSEKEAILRSLLWKVP